MQAEDWLHPEQRKMIADRVALTEGLSLEQKPMQAEDWLHPEQRKMIADRMAPQIKRQQEVLSQLTEKQQWDIAQMEFHQMRQARGMFRGMSKAAAAKLRAQLATDKEN